ncbi:MAG: HNH endonuclease [Chloroflexi bacterium]|nr:HNH endonuclease [Chloroflexota bacterium]
MKDEILSYWDMCSRQSMSLQRGMYFRLPPGHGVILMSRRRNAPYADSLSQDETILFYEGHDVRRDENTPDPNVLDQPRFETNNRPTQNGLFAAWVDDFKQGKVLPAIFRVYEKMRPGVWTDRGLYILKDYRFRPGGQRMVFSFQLEQADFDSSVSSESESVHLTTSRQIPSWIKQDVYKRDKGRCVIRGATEQLHFDHEFPFSKGGTSILVENVRILCARHNLAKSANIE